MVSAYLWSCTYTQTKTSYQFIYSTYSSYFHEYNNSLVSTANDLFAKGSDMVDLKSLRAARVIRPLKLVNGVPSKSSQRVLLSVSLLDVLKYFYMCILFVCCGILIFFLDFLSKLSNRSFFNNKQRFTSRHECNSKSNDSSFTYCLTSPFRYYHLCNYRPRAVLWHHAQALRVHGGYCRPIARLLIRRVEAHLSDRCAMHWCRLAEWH